jgi:hypothetical protein
MSLGNRRPQRLGDVLRGVKQDEDSVCGFDGDSGGVDGGGDGGEVVVTNTD